MTGTCVYHGKVMHHRLRPKVHRFVYNTASWLIDLDELPSLQQRLRFFSWNRLNLVSFYDADVGDGSLASARAKANELLRQNNLPLPARVKLLCYPRIMGFVFNPLSVYFCYNEAGQCFAIIYEVSNTFAERHAYVIPGEGCDQAVIRQAAEKRLHVSPFMTMDCHYCFRLSAPDETVSVGISLDDAEGRLFSAVFSGARQSLSDGLIIRQLLSMPFMTVKVVLAIHWQALRLWLKGLKVYTHQPAKAPYQSSRGNMNGIQRRRESRL